MVLSSWQPLLCFQLLTPCFKLDAHVVPQPLSVALMLDLPSPLFHGVDRWHSQHDLRGQPLRGQHHLAHGHHLHGVVLVMGEESQRLSRSPALVLELECGSHVVVPENGHHVLLLECGRLFVPENGHHVLLLECGCHVLVLENGHQVLLLVSDDLGLVHSELVKETMTCGPSRPQSQ
ncbi:3-phosphoshikimate 1-carboxyvinyltransferase, partial [Frankliniella fusca]